MSNYAVSLKRTSALIAALAFTAALLLVNLSIFGASADAAQLQARSLNLSSTMPGDETGSGVANDETNGDSVTYTFTFTPSTTAIGGVIFKACTTAVGTCTAPSTEGAGGRMFESATLTSDTLADGAGSWALDNTGLDTEDAACTGTNGLENCIAVANASATAQAGTSVNVVFGAVENPDVLGTFFIRIQTYNDNGFTTARDDGTVATSITEGIYITSRVAETLGFSTSGTFPDTAEGANCSALAGSGAIGLGDPTETTLSITQAYDNYTQFRVYTNASTGVDVYYDGNTLTKTGGQTIDPIASDFDSDVGAEQFGLGIDLTVGDDADNSVAVTSRSAAIDVSNIDAAADLAGDAGEISAVAGYNNADGTITEAGDAEFGFTADTPTLIAESTGYVVCNTAAVRYIANIAPTTEAGTYTTTIVYIAVPTY